MSMNTPTLLLSQLDLSISNISPIRLPAPQWGQSYENPLQSHSPKRPNSSPEPSPPRHKRHQSSIESIIMQNENVSSNTYSLPASPTLPHTLPTRVSVDKIPIITMPMQSSTGSNSQASKQLSSSTTPSGSTTQGSPPISTSYNTSDSSQSINEDPLAPRPETYSEGFYGAPRINYYTRYDRRADDEFEILLRKPLLDFIEERKYSSFCMLMSHAGYEWNTTVPVVLVVAPGMPDEDAIGLTSIFNNIRGRHVIRKIFCFDGVTELHGTEAQLKDHQHTPTPGSSIGVKDGDSAFSSGIYIRLSGEDDLFCTSVHHGVSKHSTCVDPNTTPAIVVEQPSNLDMEEKVEAAIQDLDMAQETEGAGANRVSTRELERRLHDLLDLEVQFGEVFATDFRVIEHEGQLMHSDVAVIKVSPSRQGINRIPFPFFNPSKADWGPRDQYGIYVSGVDNLRLGAVVAKSGRASGTTEGKIAFRYCYTKLEGNDVTTSEYCVVSETVRNVFCEKGDSGAPVIDKEGRVVGTILGGTYGIPKKLPGYENLGEVYLSYITPINVIIDRIETITGKTVTVEIPRMGI